MATMGSGSWSAQLRDVRGQNGAFFCGYTVAFLGRKFSLKCPLRHYYRFRNAVLLYREGWLPMNWKLVDVTGCYSGTASMSHVPSQAKSVFG